MDNQELRHQKFSQEWGKVRAKGIKLFLIKSMLFALPGGIALSFVVLYLFEAIFMGKFVLSLDDQVMLNIFLQVINLTFEKSFFIIFCILSFALVLGRGATLIWETNEKLYQKIQRENTSL